MQELRSDSTIPTAISISLSDEKDHVVIRDLNGKQYICPIDDLAKLGKKILDLVNKKDLPRYDVAELKVTNTTTTVENPLGDLNFQDFSKENLQQTLLQEGLKFATRLVSYPRGTR